MIKTTMYVRKSLLSKRLDMFRKKLDLYNINL